MASNVPLPNDGVNDDFIYQQLMKSKNKDKRLVIVTAGKSGVGKSTLINNFLQLEGDAAFKARLGPKSVTGKVNYCDREVNGIQVRLIDMPGLHAADSGDKTDANEDILGDLKGVTTYDTEKGVDVVFYCINLLSRLENVDFENMVTLTQAFGSKIWEHVIFVFTRTDSVLSDGGNLKDLVEDYIETLQNQLVERRGVNVKIRSIYSFPTDAVSEPDAEKNTFNGIVGIPVSKNPATPPNWRKTLLLQVIRKCRKENIPAILKVNYIIDWEDVKNAVATAAAAGANGKLATVGFALGGGIGAVLGGVATANSGGKGALPTAASCAAVGSSIGAGSHGFVVFAKQVASVIYTRYKIENRACLKIKEILENGQEASTTSQDQPNSKTYCIVQ